MTDPSVTGPGPELPGGQGSRLRGVLGAALGALLGSGLWYQLILFTSGSGFEKLFVLLGMAAVGWCSCWGYRLLRGFRSMGFAQWTVRACVVLAQPAALAGAFYVMFLRRSGSAPDAAAFLSLLSGGKPLVLMGLAAAGCLMFASLGWKTLLKYADPVWYDSPRRLAQIGGGGATFNYPPCWPLPPAEHIPERFDVDKGKLTVEHDVITVKARRKLQRSFSVGSVAGVVLGVPGGYNILYDRNDHALARFAWSRKNAVLLGQYLLAKGVPFVDLNGDPVPSTFEQPDQHRKD